MKALLRRAYAALLAGSVLLPGLAHGLPLQEDLTEEAALVVAASTVEVLTEEGMEMLGYYGDHSNFLAPLTSLSPLVKRVALRRGAFEFQLGDADPGVEVSVVALIHGANEFVVLDSHVFGGKPQVVADYEAPASARVSSNEDREPLSRPQTWDLAHLIRRDGHSVTISNGTSLELAPLVRKDDVKRSLLLFADSSGWGSHALLHVGEDSRSLFDGPLRPLVVESTDAPLKIRSVYDEELHIDAAMYVTPVEARVQLPLAVMFPKASEESGLRRIRCALTTQLKEALEEPDTGMTLWLQVGDGEGYDKVTPMYSSAKSRRASLPPGPLRDVTVTSGIDAVHFEGDAEQLDIRPTMGPGAAWGDIDGDGRLDVVILQGSGRPGTEALSDRVYRGTEDGRFEDITSGSGLSSGDAGMGALLIDVNGDGPLDLYCANYGQDRLFLGKGDGTFTDATDLLPKLDLWSASVTAADPDGDGDLDLYITSYLDYDLEKMPPADELGGYQREDPVEMLPFAFPGQRNVFLRNQLAETGKLGFEDVTESLGLLDVQGRGMQTVFWDFDRDGDEDLYVANDVSLNVLFRNEGDGTFKDVSFSTGLDDPRGGMGLAVGDVDMDGDEDVFLTNWQLEANALYLNSVISHSGSKRRRASFHDYTVRSGLGPSGIGATSWGAELFDMDLDGDLDLYVANGYTSPDYESTGICVGQPDHLFLGDGTGKFVQVTQAKTGVGDIAQASRGAIGADYDGDGDVDLLVTANNGRALLLQNNAERKGHWTGIRLRQPGLNTRAIGAEVIVTLPGGTAFRRSLRAGQGYLTGNAAELHFGLGETQAIESVEVIWPDGERTVAEGQLDAWQTIQRGE